MNMIKLLIASGLLVLFTTATAWSMHHEVKIAEKPGVGNFLTDTEGMTLYWFKKDMAGMSACSGACLEKWPVFYRKTVGVTGNLSADDFGTITRDDGAMQTTFRGYPLYYWSGDKAAGETNGQGVKEIWYVVDPGNFPPH